MKSSRVDFNGVARVYDALASIVFGNHIANAQQAFLNEIPLGSQILILGGGTGKILPTIISRAPKKVWYVDSSYKMIEKASVQVSKGSVVEFICGTESDIPSQVRASVVITQFYLDLFPEHELPQIIHRIASFSANEVIWLAADFIHTKSLWHRFLLKLMYTFFRTVAGLQNRILPDWVSALEAAGFKERSSLTQYGGFIKSTVLVRPVARSLQK